MIMKPNNVALTVSISVWFSIAVCLMFILVLTTGVARNFDWGRGQN